MLTVNQYRNPATPSSTPTTMFSTRSGREKRASAYNSDCAQHLTDNYVFPHGIDDEPANFQDWKEVRTRPRASLSPSRSSGASYKSFVRAVDGAQNEDEIMSNVFPRLPSKNRPPSGQNVQFGHMTPLTPKIVTAKPDYYEGSRPGPGNRTIRGMLDKAIVPSTRRELPYVPTFFAEVKGRGGTHDVGLRQLRHDGALGTRAMHSVQNLGRSERYDNEAHSASALLDGTGHLAMFTHHMTQPRGPGTPAHTHMQRLGSYSLTESPELLRTGLSAFRNVSDEAYRHRERAIQDANRRLGLSTPEGSQIASRSTLKPLSRQSGAPESTRTQLSCQSGGVKPDSDSSSSSEKDDSDDTNYQESSRRRPKRQVPKPKIVHASPQRPATRSQSTRPLTRRRKLGVSRDFDANSSSEEESSRRPRRRQLPEPEILTIEPRRSSRREPSLPRRELRSRRGSRRL